MRLHDVREPATNTGPISGLVAGKPRTLDLCDTCYKELVQPLVDLLAEQGAPVDAPAKGKAHGATSSPRAAVQGVGSVLLPQDAGGEAQGGYRCLVPGCTQRGAGSPNRAAFSAHLRYAHPDLGGVAGYEATYERLPAWLPRSVRKAAPAHDDATTSHVDPAHPDHPDYVCGIDGCTKAYPLGDYRRPAQALGVHRQQAHGVRGTRGASSQ